MARTIVPATTATTYSENQLAIKKQSARLAVETQRAMYFGQKFMGSNEETQMPIMMLTDLEADNGDTISFDLSAQMNMEPVQGEDDKEGKEQKLRFFSDEVMIDQLWAGLDCGGIMTRKRTVHDLRDTARKRSKDYWPRVFDELITMYAAGARGSNTDFLFPTSFSGFAGNSFTDPDTDHLRVCAGATSSTLSESNTMTLEEIEIINTIAETMGGTSTVTPQIQPMMFEGEPHYVEIMHTWQAHDLKTAAGSKWYDLQKALITAEGSKAPIFKGGLGMIGDTVLQKYRGIIKDAVSYTSDGSTAVASARALFMGRQAMAVAFGMRGSGVRFGWHEEYTNRGERLVIDTYTIMGIVKTNYNGKDYGIIAHDTACKNPAA